MATIKRYIKNMVCLRCIYIVQQELLKLGIAANHVGLGEIELSKQPDDRTLHQFSESLKSFGFELMDDKKSRIIEKIKHLVIEQVASFVPMQVNYSTLLSENLHHDYSYLSSLFSSVEGSTIEKFIIDTKIEKAKELLVYDELNLTEIADKLGYSSVAHLSNQFKKSTGLTPTAFKKQSGKRISLDKL